jgi:putative sugar O-methyltransferase
VDLSTPSRFWERLGSEHAADLESHGLERVKRFQALRYFTWRWQPGRLAGSEQLRFLVRHARPSDWRAALQRPFGASGEQWADLEWSPGERRAYVLAVRLLWRYALRHGDPMVMQLSEPELGAPLPVRLDGRLISQDLANSALEVAAMCRALRETPPARIIEIGAGYGRSTFALAHRFPEARCTIVDIEPAASISRWYLDRLLPGRVEVISPEQALELPDGAFDLGLSISSLHEMRLDQIAGYLELLDRVCAGGVVYLKQWQEWQNPVDGVRAEFDAYPFPDRWRAALRERCAVQTKFVQAAWQVPA